MEPKRIQENVKVIEKSKWILVYLDLQFSKKKIKAMNETKT